MPDAAIGQWFSLAAWARFVVHPIGGVQSILAETHDRAPEIKVWLPALTAALIADYPIGNLFGIQWTNLGYYLSSELIAIVTILVAVTFLFAFLRILRLPVSFRETRALYTFVVGYSPITALIEWPLFIQILSVVQDVKHKAHNPIEGLQALFAVRGQLGYPGTLVGEIASDAATFIGFILLALVAEALIDWFGAGRVRAYIAVGLGAVIGQTISGYLVQVLRTIDIYGFVS